MLQLEATMLLKNRLGSLDGVLFLHYATPRLLFLLLSLLLTIYFLAPFLFGSTSKGEKSIRRDSREHTRGEF